MTKCPIFSSKRRHSKSIVIMKFICVSQDEEQHVEIFNWSNKDFIISLLFISKFMSSSANPKLNVTFAGYQSKYNFLIKFISMHQ